MSTDFCEIGLRESSSNEIAFTELILEVFRLNGLLLEACDRITQPIGLSSARWQVLSVVWPASSKMTKAFALTGKFTGAGYLLLRRLI